MLGILLSINIGILIFTNPKIIKTGLIVSYIPQAFISISFLEDEEDDFSKSEKIVMNNILYSSSEDIMKILKNQEYRQPTIIYCDTDATGPSFRLYTYLVLWILEEKPYNVACIMSESRSWGTSFVLLNMLPNSDTEIMKWKKEHKENCASDEELKRIYKMKII